MDQTDQDARQLEVYEAALKHVVPIITKAIDETVAKGITFPEPLPQAVASAIVAHAIIASGAILAQERGVPLNILQFILSEVLRSAVEVQKAARAPAEPPKPLVTLT